MQSEESWVEISKRRRKWKKVEQMLVGEARMSKRMCAGAVTFVGLTEHELHGTFGVLVAYHEDAELLHCEVHAKSIILPEDQVTPMCLFLHDYQRDQTSNGAIYIEEDRRFTWKFTPLWHVTSLSVPVIKEYLYSSMTAGLAVLSTFFEDAHLAPHAEDDSAPPFVIVPTLPEDVNEA